MNVRVGGLVGLGLVLLPLVGAVSEVPVVEASALAASQAERIATKDASAEGVDDQWRPGDRFPRRLDSRAMRVAGGASVAAGPGPYAESAQGDWLEIVNARVSGAEDVGCGGLPYTWGGDRVGFCAQIRLHDVTSASGNPPSSNRQSDVTWDACGNQVLSGSTINWSNAGTQDELESGLIGSMNHTVPTGAGICYGDWLTEYTLTQTFTNDAQLTVSMTFSFPVFSSKTAALSAQSPQQTPTGGPIAATEQLGGCGQTRSTHQQATDYPVDTATGNFWHTFSDLVIPGRGPAIEVERSYNSLLASVDGPFGFGWSDRYGEHLELGATEVLLRGCNGAITRFTKQDEQWTAPPRVLGTLRHNADDTWTYIKAGHTTYTFDTAGRLMSISDLNGETTRVTYPDPATRVVTDAAGRTVTFIFTAGRITSIADSSTPARSATYEYDDAGNLTDVIDVGGGHWVFTYDDAHRMLTMRSPKYFGVTLDPAPVVTNQYDSQGRVASQSDQLGRTTTFDYTTIPGSTIVTDPAGNATAYEYKDGLLVLEKRGYGSSKPSDWMYRYDPDTLGRTTVINGNGKTLRATYEPDGDRSSMTDALGRTTTYTYNDLHQVTSITGPRRVSGKPIPHTFHYDATGNLLWRSSALLDSAGNTVAEARTTFEHGDATHPGDVTAVVDPNGNRNTQTFDAYGNLTSVRQPATPENPAGNMVSYGYDAPRGWLTSVVAPRGNLAGANPADYTTKFDHDAYGRVTRVRTPEWSSETPSRNQTLRTYDPDGQLRTVTDGNGHTSTLTHNAAGELIVVDRPDGTQVSTTYWPDGSVKTQTDANGGTTSYTYDPLGYPLTRTDPLGRVTRFETDALGAVTFVAEAGFEGTEYDRDDAGQVTAIRFTRWGQDNVTGITYDADGRRASLTDATGTTTWSYDSLGRLVSTTDGLGATTGYTYDLGGRQTSIAYPQGVGTVVREYDDANRLNRIRDFSDRSFTFSYDADSNLTGAAYPNGTQSAYTFNRGNQLTEIQHFRDASPGQPFASFNYTYDGDGQVTSVQSTGVPGDNHTYGYDSLGRLNQVDTTALTYDAAGNLTRRLDGRTQDYDIASQMVRVSHLGITRVGTSSATSATSNSLTVPFPAGTGTGDRAIVAISFPAGKSVTPDPSFASLGAVSSGGSKGVTTEFFVGFPAAGATSATFTFQGKHDKTATMAVYRGVESPPIRGMNQGATTGTTLTVGSVNASRGDRLVWVSGAHNQPGTWTVPPQMTAQVSRQGTSTDSVLADQDLTSTGETGARTGTHAPSTGLSGALIALKAAGTNYTYNERGGRTAWKSPDAPNETKNTFDGAGRLIRHGASATYSYNADGLRVSKTVDGVTKNFTWDTTTGNPDMLSDGTADYIYGPTGPLERIQGGSATYYQQDRLGSTRAITDQTGDVVGTYTYDAFGNPTASTGTTANPLGYTGQYQDPESGYLYLRLRYYDPATANFISRDPLEASTGTPYSYANSNPTNVTDPSGACPPCLAVVGGAVLGAGMDLGFQSLMNVVNGCDPLYDISWSQVGVSGVLGAIPGVGYARTAGLAAKSATGADSALSGALLNTHLRQLEKYGQGGVRELESGRFRYYGNLTPAAKQGEMAGRQLVREWDPATGATRTWHETIDRSGNIRIVRPETGGPKTHYGFDEFGNYGGAW